MPLALFDILMGKCADDQPMCAAPAEQQTDLSILSHLGRLLNARQGSLLHLPDYGLPDITEIYKGLPYSIDKLISAIKKTVEKYEPRLKNVLILQKKSVGDINNILHLEIHGSLIEGRKTQFDTYFLKTGQTKIAMKLL